MAYNKIGGGGSWETLFGHLKGVTYLHLKTINEDSERKNYLKLLFHVFFFWMQ